VIHSAATHRSRAEQKSHTRQALLDAALDLLRDRGLSGLGLREVTRAAGITPAAFYRHFPGIPELGVALVEQSLGQLRTAARAVRAGLTGGDAVIAESMRLLWSETRAHPDTLRFIARERHGGVAPVRTAIAGELRRFADELAEDLRDGTVETAGYLAAWPAEDVRMATMLIVDHMVRTVAALLDVLGDPDAEAEAVALATAQLRLIEHGCRAWPAAS
jgi:AcrR family transcriptional regulator